MMDDPTIGARLLSARHAAGLTLGEVAEAAGMSKGYLSIVEQEVRPDGNGIGSALLARLCLALGVSADWLLGLEPTGEAQDTLLAENVRLRRQLRRIRECLEEGDEDGS